MLRLGRQFLHLGLLIALSTASFGCASSAAEREAQTAVSAYFAGNYDRAVEILGPISLEPDRNYVLNNLRLGEAALAAGDLDTAEAAYFRAYETLNAAGVNNAARSAATVLFNEEVRIWLGEPYERALANFQLGMVYYLQQDYANARGAFENALFKLRRYADEEDAEANFEEQESTFALAHLMLGRCWQRMGREDLAEQSFATAVELDPSLEPLADPELNARSNVLVVAAYGRGPQKVADGPGISFAAPYDPMLPMPRVRVNGARPAMADLAVPTIDTNVMARERRWQTTDTFRAVKAVAGTGLMYGGVVVLDNGLRKDSGDTALAGAIMIGVGALLSASSSPDVRQWEMVPRTIYLIPMELPPGEHDITVALPDSYGFGEVTHQFLNVTVPPEGETSLYARLLPGRSGVTDFAPPPPQPEVLATD